MADLKNALKLGSALTAFVTAVGTSGCAVQSTMPGGSFGGTVFGQAPTNNCAPVPTGDYTVVNPTPGEVAQSRASGRPDFYNGWRAMPNTTFRLVTSGNPAQPCPLYPQAPYVTMVYDVGAAANGPTVQTFQRCAALGNQKSRFSECNWPTPPKTLFFKQYPSALMDMQYVCSEPGIQSIQRPGSGETITSLVTNCAPANAAQFNIEIKGGRYYPFPNNGLR